MRCFLYLTLNFIGTMPTYSSFSSSDTELNRQFFRYLIAISSSLASAFRTGIISTTEPSLRILNSSSIVTVTDVSTDGGEGLNMSFLLPALPFIPNDSLLPAASPFYL